MHQATLLSQLLQFPQNHQIRIQEPVYTLPHTRLLIFIQRALLHLTRRYAFSETRVGEGVNRYTQLSLAYFLLT